MNPNGFIETGASFFYKRANPNGFERFPKLSGDTQYFDVPQAESLLKDCTEILRIVGSTTKTMKIKLKITNS